MEKVSIIIPVYNNEAYIGKCIQSILEQSWNNLEIIVINDGSTDRTGSILNEFVQKDNRVQVYYQKNAGTAAARNNGIKKATGEFITFIDGDDYIGQNYIRDMVNKAVELSLEIVISGLNFVDKEGKIKKVIVPGEYLRFKKEEWAFRIAGVWCHLYKRSLWEKYQVEFEVGERGEDLPISLFFSAVCDKIGTLSKADYYYVQHENSAMYSFKGLKKYCLPYRGIEKAIKKVNEVGIKNSKEFYELFVFRILASCISLARGARKEQKKDLCIYIYNIVNLYFPEYQKNSKLKLRNNVEVPLRQKLAVWLLVKAIERKKLLKLLYFI